jgi:aryl-alcohol dehydrogenase-like predicted oxidoreductase
MMLNKLILGTVQLGMPYGINNLTGQVDISEGFNILQTAYDSGIRMLDTAELYGTAHQLIGEFHDQNPNKKFNIITKFPHHFTDNIEVKIQGYLDQLRIKSLEAIMFHSFGSYKEHIQAIDNLVELKLRDKINLIGVSVYTNEEMEQVINDEKIDLIQLPFNLFDNNYQRRELLAAAKHKAKIIHVRSVFLQGLFFMDIKDKSPIVHQLQSELIFINELAKQNKISLSQLALSYAMQQHNIDNVLIGVDNEAQLLDHIKNSANLLDNALKKEIDSIKIANKDLLNPSLWNK